MAEDEGQQYKPGSQAETDNKTARGKILDMMVYAMPLIEKWSVCHQKLLGNKLAEIMEEMLLLANDVQWLPNKKTPLKKLDSLNKGLHDMIEAAYELKYLQGPSSLHEWQRRSEEIGRLIGGLTAAIYGDGSPPKEKQVYRHTTHGRRG